MAVINTIGNLHNWLNESFGESVDDSDINVDSYCSGLNGNIDVFSTEEGGVQSWKEASARGNEGAGVAQSSEVTITCRLFRNNNPFALDPLDSYGPSSWRWDTNNCVGRGRQSDESSDSDQLDILLNEEDSDWGLDVGGKGEVGVGGWVETISFIISEDISSFDVEDVGSIVLVVCVKIADFEVSSILILEVLDEHDLGDVVLALSIILHSLDERRVSW